MTNNQDNSLRMKQVRPLDMSPGALPDSSPQQTDIDVDEASSSAGRGKSGKWKSEIVKKRNRNGGASGVRSKRRRVGVRGRHKPAPDPKLKACGTSEDDSGLPMSSDFLPGTVDDKYASDSDVSVAESISMLQISSFAGDNDKRDVPHVEDGLPVAWNIRVFPTVGDDEEYDDGGEVSRVEDKSVQTERVLCPSVSSETDRRDIDFLSSVITLKAVLSSGSKCLSTRKRYLRALWDGRSVLKDTMRWNMKSGNEAEVTERCVDSILQWLRRVLYSDWSRAMMIGRSDAMIDEVVGLVNEAVESSPTAARGRASTFLAGVYDEFWDPQSPIEDSTLERKSYFLSNFCQSPLLRFDLINHIESKLAEVELFTDATSSSEASEFLGRKLRAVAFAKSLYFSLRLLRHLFRSLLGDLSDEFVVEAFPESKTTWTGVMEMWRENWRTATSTGMDDSDARCRTTVLRTAEGWHLRAEAILRECTSKAPLLAAVAHDCSALSREIICKVRDLVLGRGTTNC